MHFIVIAKDGTDERAPERRQAAREAHLANINASIKHMVTAGATFDAEGRVDGSLLVVDFPSRNDLVEWLQTDPYVVQSVWQDIVIQTFRPAPAFQNDN